MKTAEDEEFERIEREIARRAREDDDTTCYQSELNAAVLAEREACAKVCEGHDELVHAIQAIRARGDT